MNRYFFGLLLAILPGFVFGQKSIETNAALEQAAGQFAHKQLQFIENKGQVTDQFGQCRKDVQYKLAGNGASIFVSAGKFQYQFFRRISDNKKKDRLIVGQLRGLKSSVDFPDTAHVQYDMYRMEMVLEGANNHAKVIAEEKQSYTENYYTAALHTDASPALSYGKITYKDIYPNIDWVLYIKENKLEYDFMVRPGAKVSDIKIKYDGATSIAHSSGSIIKAATPLGDVKEDHLCAYEQAGGRPIAATSSLQGNAVSYKVADYKGTLVIDPVLSWGTYFGSGGVDAAFGTACDPRGNVFLCGLTTSVDNIATTGSYQTTIGGWYDAFLAKFSTSGALLWATYYGSNGFDECWGMACDNAGNAYITGLTLSDTGLSTPGALNRLNNGGYDAFLAKFNGNGALQWGTYFGGNVSEFGRSVACDSRQNVYLCGQTSSPTNVATTGSFQDTMGCASSGENAFLAKFNTDGALSWSTYFGGKAGYKDSIGNAAFACACDRNDNVYIGGTVLGSNILSTVGCYQDTCAGGTDCFIAKFNTVGQLKWSTYYGGTNGGEGVASMVCDSMMNLYVTGLTSSTNQIASAGAYQGVYGGGIHDGFVVKFNDSGKLEWSTYFGGELNDEPSGITLYGQNFYVTGYTISKSGISTADGYQTVFSGVGDVFIAEFAQDGRLIWGSYYGGEADQVSNGIASDSNGSVYIAGSTNSVNNIATLGSFKDTFSDTADAFLIKFTTKPTRLPSATRAVDTIRLFPCPNNGVFDVSGEVLANGTKNISVTVLNTVGRVIYSTYWPVVNQKIRGHIDISYESPGEYIFNAVSPNRNTSIKFEIK